MQGSAKSKDLLDIRQRIGPVVDSINKKINRYVTFLVSNHSTINNPMHPVIVPITIDSIKIIGIEDLCIR